jgi:hypothetical protein
LFLEGTVNILKYKAIITPGIEQGAGNTIVIHVSDIIYSFYSAPFFTGKISNNLSPLA